MEVHHHAHTERKKWTHYVWEFFMLFLAVFCGFLAEYALEHKIEADREKQYAISMVEDLKLDTAALHRIIQLRTNRLVILDSLFLLLDETENSSNLSTLYYYSAITSRFGSLQFIYNDRTIQQLKNSGSLRLIRNKIVSDSITLYYGSIRRLENVQEREDQNFQDLKPYRLRIFDGRIYDKMFTNNDRIRRPEGNPALLLYTKDDLNGFIGNLVAVKASNIGYIRFSIDLLKQAINVLNTIKTEYHLN
jgi:hypothetical protein